jgi:hypothetical protein
MDGVFPITPMLLRIQVTSDMTNKYGIQSVSTDGGTWRPQDMKYAESKNIVKFVTSLFGPIRHCSLMWIVDILLVYSF